jgi:ABC-2 type transport system ATP-binding protein
MKNSSETIRNAIEVKNISKSFENKKLAVDNLSFTVKTGETYALLGPNGAGKSTTISILTTINESTSGDAFVNGYNVKINPEKVRSCIGVTFQEMIIDEELTGYQVLDYHGKLYGMKAPERNDKISFLLELVDLKKDMNRKCKEYSGGMKRRLELIRSLVTEPHILFLDEPTLGLDPMGRTKVWEYIKTLKNKNKITILLTTHYLDEAHQLADRIGIINKGTLVKEGVPNRMIDELGKDVIKILGNGYTETLKDKLISLPFIQSFEYNKNIIQIGLASSAKHLAEVVTLVTENNFTIEEVTVSKPDLGAVFLKYTGELI